ncbi:hypothetical protein CsSME_00011599 [Camellia sinensis var. sinensis]
MGIFEPFRAIGYITSSVPFSVQRLGTETFVTVSVGKSWQIYNCAKLSLVLVGPQLPKKIRALAAYRDYTFAAYGNNIAVFKRAHQVATWSRHTAKVNLLILFGEHILSVDIDGNIFIWAFKGIDQNHAPIGHILLEDKFSPTCIMHPDTYLNKVILGSQEGSLQLWNISTKKKLYEFKGWKSSICCCISSPALDVVAVGCADGKIHVHNIRYDEEIVTFTHSTRGAVTALSFSTDGQPLLASGGSSGIISIWNLEKRRLQSVIREAHDSSIISLHFFANEPVLMSSSADNSVKMWIFDTSDGDPRLLRFRSGHSAPPVCIRFYANGRHILSAGQDRAFRLFSVIQDQQSRELSQRHVSKRAKKLRLKEEEIKLKPVISFDVGMTSLYVPFFSWMYELLQKNSITIFINFLFSSLFYVLAVNLSLISLLYFRCWVVLVAEFETHNCLMCYPFHIDSSGVLFYTFYFILFFKFFVLIKNAFLLGSCISCYATISL